MAAREFRSGNSSAVFTPVPAVPAKKDHETVRLTTPLHVAPAVAGPTEFRVIGVGPGDREALVCFAETRGEAAAQMREHADRFGLLRLERWVGSAHAGRWSLVAVRVRREPRRRRGRDLRITS